MRSPQETEPPLPAVRSAPEGGPGVEAEASESMLETISSSESEPSETDSELSLSGQTSSSSSIIRDLAPDDSVPQIFSAQAWEAQALEAQARVGQPKQNSVPEVTHVSVLKSKPSKEKVQVEKKEESDDFLARPLWPRKVEYILALVGYTTWPFNLWRFVYLWLHKGGVSFFIIYTTMLLFVGTPLLFLEMAVGQRMRRNSMSSWRIITPWARGLGYASFMMCLITGTYINTANAWILFYLSHCFQLPVPWEKCPLLKNSSDFDPECAQMTPSVYFWYRQTLKVADRIEDGGPLVMSLGLPFFVSWCLVGAITTKGLKFLGKSMYILVPLPYGILFCFFIWSLHLEGAKHGLKYLLVAKVSAIYDPNVWSVVGSQVLSDLGLGFGSVASLASHMPQSNNCLIDAFVMALINLVTLSLITPFILAVLGFWATVHTHRCSEKNTEMLSMLVHMGTLPPKAQPPTDLHDDPTSIYSTWLSSLAPDIRSLVLSSVPNCNREELILQVREGPGFVFLSFVEVSSFLPRSVFWSVLFFLVMLSLGLSATLGVMQGLVIPLQDTSSFFRRQTRLLTGSVSMLMFLTGLSFTRPPGIYFIRLLNKYWTPLPIVLIVICENIAVAWACGAKRFLGDLMNLRSSRLVHGFALRFCSCLWSCVTPVVLLVMFVAILVERCVKPITYLAWNSSSSTVVTRQYPSWALMLMITLLLTVIAPIPAYLFYCLTRRIPFRPSCGVKLTKSSTSLSKEPDNAP